MILPVVSTAKVQKIWEQFTTYMHRHTRLRSCFDCKSTKNLRAIHNINAATLKNAPVVSTAKVQKIWEQFTTLDDLLANPNPVVSTAKVQKIWEQFTTVRLTQRQHGTLFRLQKYKKFESNSQPNWRKDTMKQCCFDCKSTKNLRAIHNYR